MKTQKLFPAVVAALFSGLTSFAQAQASASDQNPFAGLPFNDPQPLLQLMTLDDSAFLRRLFDTGSGPDILDRLFPSGQTVYPMSHGFAGPQSTCLQTRSALACRLYMADMITINEDNGSQSRVHSNPFAPLR